MKYRILIIFVLIAGYTHAQPKNLLVQKKYFDSALKPWTSSFRHFKLSAFKFVKTISFENLDRADFSHYKNFLSIYKPLLAYSPDSSRFIDTYSYQLNLEKKKGYFLANVDVDQSIDLCIPSQKYWKRIYFGSPGGWIDEACWTSTTKFILLGIEFEGDKKIPVVLVGDTNKQNFDKYMTSDSSCFQKPDSYQSARFKKMKIRM